LLVSYTDLNADDIEMNSDITIDLSNKKNLKKRPTAMENRMFGQNYTGFRRLGKNVFQDTNRDCRKIKPRCNSTVCIKSKECNKLTEEDRLNLFNCFWATTWDEKKTYIINLVTQEDTKRKTTGKYEVKSRRSSSYQYHLRDMNEKKIRVCKKMFLATLDLNEWMVHNWVKKSNGLSPKVYKKNVKNKDPETNEQMNKIAFTVRYDHFIKWFDKLPKMESHYCRKRTNRLYLEGPFESKQQLYSLYVQEAKHVKYTPVSRACFNKFIKSKKFSIFKPRKDQCDLCCSYKTNQVTENEYQEHILNKDLAREQLKSDTEKANNQENYTFTMDVQAVKLCPAMNASALYYSMKLKVHNFTIYNVNNEHQCHNYWWNECEGELDASVFVSILLSHLETYCINIDQEEKKNIILFSDGCGYQNRNSILSNALLNFSVQHNVVIEQKFLIKGHTQMPCDSVHSAIERKLKNKEIHLPSDYVRITKEARTLCPYQATLLDHTFFNDYKINQTYKSIRPGKGKGDPEVRDIRALKYDPVTQMIYYKLNFNDSCYLPLTLPRNKHFELNKEYPKLYAKQIPLTLSKWTDLQKLKHVLPVDTHAFYDSLPHADTLKQRKSQGI